jgi:amidohydrolase
MLQTIEKDMMEVFTHLHEHPELSFEEYETTRYLAGKLAHAGIRVTTFEDMPGLVAEIGNGQPVVAVRADMDALLQEVDGEIRANHSCGHDAHMTIVFGLLLFLKEREHEWNGTLRCIFQPAEEKGNGSLQMVEKGAVDDAAYLLGIHLRPKEEADFGFAAPSLQHGAAVSLEGEILGEDSHGARPHLGVNAIEVGHSLQQFLRSIHLPPNIPSSIKMTSFHAGTSSYNIIPGKATFSLDLRAQTNGVLADMREKVETALKAASDFHGAEINGKWLNYTPAAEVSAEAESIMKESIISVLGEEHCLNPIVTPGSDDFHFYTIERPHLKACMLALGADLTPGLHHPDMTFNKDCLLMGARILEEAVLRAFSAINETEENKSL